MRGPVRQSTAQIKEEAMHPDDANDVMDDEKTAPYFSNIEIAKDVSAWLHALDERDSAKASVDHYKLAVQHRTAEIKEITERLGQCVGDSMPKRYVLLATGVLVRVQRRKNAPPYICIAHDNIKEDG